MDDGTWTFESVIDSGKEKEFLTSQNAKFLLQLIQDPVLYQEFREFIRLSKSQYFVIVLNFGVTFLFIPPIFANALQEEVLLSSFELLTIIVTLTSGWFLCGLLQEDTLIRRHCSSLLLWTRNTSWELLLDQIQAVLYLSLVILMSLMMIRRVLGGDCHGVSRQREWSCNPGASSNVYPLDSALALMMIPIVFCSVMKEMRIMLTTVAWCIVMFTLIFSTFVFPSFMSCYSTILYGLVSITVLIDLHKQYLQLYLLNRQLKKKLIEGNQSSSIDQNKTKEMRHMIANVAHDLKTPLSSFMTGIEMIAADVADFEEKMHSLKINALDTVNSDYLLSFASSLQSIILNVRNTNAFMLMTINRCLDYTKASNGMKLVPKYETIELSEALSLPVFCMMNMQQKNKISLLPYHEEGICSHVITDKQWLQENVLCLLSNAVKYSAGGDILIRVTKVKEKAEDSLPIESTVKTTRLQNGSAKTVWMNARTKRKVRVQARYHHDKKVVPTNDIEQQQQQQIELTNGSENKALKDLQNSDKEGEDDDDVSVVTRRVSFHHPLSHQVGKVDGEIPLPSTQESEELLFEVIDYGIGVPTDAMNSLFNPFKQTQRLAGGTGLGLYSLAKRIEALKGKYGVRQRLDGKQGSVFWFTIPYKPDLLTAGHCMACREETTLRRRSMTLEALPIYTTPATTRIAKNEGQILTKVMTDHVSSLRILLAEDTLSIAKMMKLLLNRKQHEVTVAENGQIALDLLKEGEYDVVLMDLQMPVMDGLEATRRIRASEGLSDVKDKHQIVIGVSANSDNETMEEGLRAGIDDFLPKPFSMELFMETMQRIEERKQKKT